MEIEKKACHMTEAIAVSHSVSKLARSRDSASF
jgi:hypothetical protein